MYKFKNQTQKMVLTAAFAAIIIVMANVPFLGFIRLGIISATTLHIPVIIGAVLLGARSGAFLGFIFGSTSCIQATFQPNLTSFCFSPFYSVGELHGNFWSLVVCFVPRILIGVIAYFVFAGLMKVLKGKRKVKETIALPIAGIAGSMTNTILVMGGIYVFFGEQYASVLEIGGVLYKAILAVVVGNGIPEAIVCAILVTMIGKALLHFVEVQ
ncbi:MAG: ECF transporter S component [Lachnospiraceae bacterium]|nr:ECF transporter S component [Lachnospiraceae bacterium]